MQENISKMWESIDTRYMWNYGLCKEL